MPYERHDGGCFEQMNRDHNRVENALSYVTENQQSSSEISRRL